MRDILWEHPSEDALERYAMGTLGEVEAEPLEEHLLVCAQCQDRLAETDVFVRAVRQAARELQSRREAARGKHLPRAMLPKPIWAAAAATVITLGTAGLWIVQHRHQAPPVAVALESWRGSEAVGAKAPAGRRLLLEPDLTGLPQSADYELEVVSAQGRTVRRIAVRRRAASAEADVGRLERGRYWARLRGPAPRRELLREFGLTVE